jgi:hypothetical protein
VLGTCSIRGSATTPRPGEHRSIKARKSAEFASLTEGGGSSSGGGAGGEGGCACDCWPEYAAGFGEYLTGFLVGLCKPHPFQAFLCALCASVFPKPRCAFPIRRHDESTSGNRSLSNSGAGDLETQRHRGHGVDCPSRTRRKTLPCAHDVFREYSSGPSLQVKRATRSEAQRDFALARFFAAAMSCQQSLAHPGGLTSC